MSFCTSVVSSILTLYSKLLVCSAYANRDDLDLDAIISNNMSLPPEEEMVVNNITATQSVQDDDSSPSDDTLLTSLKCLFSASSNQSVLKDLGFVIPGTEKSSQPLARTSTIIYVCHLHIDAHH